MNEIIVDYTNLKKITLSIRKLISESAGIHLNEINANASINNDFGIEGDDWDEILFPFMEKFNEMNGFSFYEHFYDEGQITNNITLSFLLLPLKLFGLLILPWSKLWAIKIWRIGALKEKPPIYVGDLIATAAVGKFTKRSNCKFVLKR